MRVRCIKIIDIETGREEIRTRNGWITIGKEYTVLSLDVHPVRGIYYRLIADDGGTAGLESAAQFLATSMKLPSNWQAKVDGDGHLELAPLSWLRPGFWEKYLDREPEAVAEFEIQQELIYAEDAGRPYHSNPRRHLKELIEEFLEGVDHPVDHVRHIQTYLDNQFNGTDVREELEYYLAAYLSNSEISSRIYEPALTRAFCYVLSIYLQEE
jgi:hypothetical protein